MTDALDASATAFARRAEAAIARLAPPGPGDRAARRARLDDDGYTAIELTPPRSDNAVGDAVRRTTVKSVRWYVGWVTTQLLARLRTLAAALGQVEQRVDVLEDERDDHDTRALDVLVASAAPDPGDESWHNEVVAALADVDGRILHANAGSGTLVAALEAAGRDAYGVEPTPGAGDTAADRGLEVHEAAAVAHLRRVPDGVLAAIVLSGCVEWLPASELARLVSAAARTLRADGRVMIVSATRDSWSTHAGPITRDLARGHPLDPATWGVLLERAGFGAVHTRRGAERYVVAARRT